MTVDSLSTLVGVNGSFTIPASAESEFNPDGLGHEFSLIPPAIKCVRGLSLFRSGHRRASRSTVLETRQIEFDHGCRCAAQALRLAGMEMPREAFSQSGDNCLAGLIGHNPDGSLNWPQGFIGSLAQSERWVWAAIARQQEVLSIGIDTALIVDAQQAGSLSNEMGDGDQWRQLLDAGLHRNQACAVLSSAKASFFRYWYPLLQRRWNFSDVELESITPRRREQVPKNCTWIHGSMRLRLKSSFSAGLALPDQLCPTKSLTVHYHIDTPDVFTIAWQLNRPSQ